MNFSERGVLSKQHHIKSGTKKIAIKGAITAYRLFIIALISAIIVGSFGAVGAIRGLVSTAPSIEDLNLTPSSYKTTIYYSDGSVADTIHGAGANRTYAYVDEIPQVVLYAFIAKEDSRFYEHKGIDVQGIFRAIVSDIKTKSFDYGGSTLTQQLIKNQIFAGGDESNVIEKISRKVQEQYLAIQAESVYTKDEILEYYLNVINLGNGNYGIQAAAQGYFHKDVSELTLSEACVLAPIAYSPTYRNPVRYPEKNAQYRKELLDEMLKQGYCTEDEYEEAINEDIYEIIQANQTITEETTSKPFTYFTDELIERLLADLQSKLGYTEAEASDLIYSGGLSIYTTQNKRIQEIVDEVFTDESNYSALGKGSYYELTYALSVYNPDGKVTHYHLNDLLKYFSDYADTQKLYYHEDGINKGISELCISADELNEKCDTFKAAMMKEGDKCVENRVLTIQPQMAITIMDQHTGEVVAIYGGRGEKKASRVFNRATDTVRQVGSIFKVLASFLPALDAGGMTLATVVDDSQFVYPGTTKEVANWYHDGYRGYSNMRQACYDSMNVCAIEYLQDIGATVSFNYLKKLGFTTLVTSKKVNGVTYSDINLTLALGGLTDGVTNLELNAAYASIANGGVYQSPIFYTAVYDHDGNLLLSNESKATQVMKASTAYLLTDAMKDVLTLGTGTRLKFLNYEMPVAGKTGTSTKANDLWFAGYTPYYTATIWTGFDNNLFTGITTYYHQYMWRKIMETIHEEFQLEYKEFEMPDTIVGATICKKCGKLAVQGLCDQYEGGNCITTEIFASGTVPTEKCTCHVRVKICKDSGHLACDECPTSSIIEKVLLNKVERQYIDVDAMEKAWAKGETYEPPKDKDGNEIITYVTTWDTPYIVPNGEKAEPCPIHNTYVPEPDTPDESEETTGSEDENKD